MQPLEAGQRWQADLWCALIADIARTDGEAASLTSRAALHRQFCAAAACRQVAPPGWPRRVTVFGLSSLPRQFLDVLLEISRFTQVLLCVHNPCQHYWADLRVERSLRARQARRHPARDWTSEDLHLQVHPLLASWGRQGQDYIALLDELDQPESYRALFAQVGRKIDLWESPLGEGEGDAAVGVDAAAMRPTAGLLQRLQDDILQLRSLEESRSAWPLADLAGDASLRFHIAHSPQREVEILHDALLAAFDQDAAAALRPRDIIVMVPDIQAYAPHIEAVFGQIERADDRYIPFSIADLGQRYQAPLATALEFLLGLPEARLAVSELFDFLDVPAVRRRYGIDEGALPLLRQWVQQTHIRWGLDGAQRGRLLEQAWQGEQNTWRHGLRRMLLGYAVGSDPHGREALDWRGIEPYGEVAGLSAALAGPLVRLIGDLEKYAAELAEPATPAAVEVWLVACTAAGLQELLPLAVVREHWLSQLDTKSLNQRFMVGSVTFATLMPMRAIPFKWVGLLGMNDGDYPRAHPPLDFDLMAREMRPGDRSRREDDRYLFLEALLSARQHLHISWVGRSIVDQSVRPPSVLVSQLREHIEALYAPPALATAVARGAALRALTVEHRLQAFSSAYFPAHAQDSPFYTYAREWMWGDAPGTADVEEPPLPEILATTPVTLGQLMGFLKCPVQTFFHERLAVRYLEDALTSADQEPFSLDALESWALQDALIDLQCEAWESQASPQAQDALVQQQLARFQRQGALPVAAKGQLAQEMLALPLEAMFRLYAQARTTWAEPLADLPFAYAQDGLQVEGLITHRYRNPVALEPGDMYCRVELISSNLLEKSHYRKDKLLAAWVTHLAAQLAGPSLPTLLVGKNGQVRLLPLPPEEARRHFTTLVAAYRAGLCAPLPLAAKTGFVWLEKGEAAACKMYEGDDFSMGELQRNDYLARAWPDYACLVANGQFAAACRGLLEPLSQTLVRATYEIPVLPRT